MALNQIMIKERWRCQNPRDNFHLKYQSFMINLKSKQDIVKARSKQERDTWLARVRIILTAQEAIQCIKRLHSLNQIKKQSTYQESVIIYNQITQPRLRKNLKNKRAIKVSQIFTTTLIIEKKRALALDQLIWVELLQRKIIILWKCIISQLPYRNNLITAKTNEIIISKAVAKILISTLPLFLI